MGQSKSVASVEEAFNDLWEQGENNLSVQQTFESYDSEASLFQSFINKNKESLPNPNLLKSMLDLDNDINQRLKKLYNNQSKCDSVTLEACIRAKENLSNAFQNYRTQFYERKQSNKEIHDVDQNLITTYKDSIEPFILDEKKINKTKGFFARIKKVFSTSTVQRQIKAIDSQIKAMPMAKATYNWNQEIKKEQAKEQAKEQLQKKAQKIVKVQAEITQHNQEIAQESDENTKEVLRTKIKVKEKAIKQAIAEGKAQGIEQAILEEQKKIKQQLKTETTQPQENTTNRSSTTFQKSDLNTLQDTPDKERVSNDNHL